jgi:hypothetical protein
MKNERKIAAVDNQSKVNTHYTPQDQVKNFTPCERFLRPAAEAKRRPVKKTGRRCRFNSAA